MATSLDHRRACERRIWRLAYLLTGNGPGAAMLVDRVRAAQPDLAALEPARLDRLVISHARELPRLKELAPAASLQSASPPPAAARMLEAILQVAEQPREAFVLARIDELDELHISRAMDCSRTASGHHLEAADEQLRAQLGAELPALLTALRQFADSLNPDPLISAARAQQRQQRLRRAVVIGGILMVLALLAALAFLQGWHR